MLELDRARVRLLDGAGRRFDAIARAWVADTASGGTPVSMGEAVAWLQRESGAPLREPIGVIGPREAGAEHVPPPRRSASAWRAWAWRCSAAGARA